LGTGKFLATARAGEIPVLLVEAREMAAQLVPLAREAPQAWAAVVCAVGAAEGEWAEEAVGDEDD
jgi:hypothetical protein